jgi:hypothetical protein
MNDAEEVKLTLEIGCVLKLGLLMKCVKIVGSTYHFFVYEIVDSKCFRVFTKIKKVSIYFK